ncbi:hypothetical protein J5N97_000458 [Dioscorea zingiberensis]|uniref:Uncharacterized protein n=1 Tax=Dioscorea zingiberensis TaxID=325984 RepID=A0A9D5H1D5_9LILI|nr:hypothetical protein J5N97_000458 [Dioscorea zingiberensis]
MASSYLGACTPRASQFSLHGHRHRCPILLEQARTAPFAGNRGVSLKVRAASSDGGGESYLGMWKKAMENEKKAVKFQKIVENSARGQRRRRRGREHCGESGAQEPGVREDSGGSEGGEGSDSANAVLIGMQDGSISVPQSEESSGTWTPGPDFWSWTPPESSDSSDDIIDLQAA